ncbi:MAG: SIMPL domain-containing protein [Pseudomonadota bacterium]
MRHITLLGLWLVSSLAVADPSVIRVKGEATTEVPPDFVQVDAIVYAEFPTVAEAKQAVDKNAREVIKALKRFKIEQQDLAFSGIAVQRRVEYERGNNEKTVGIAANRTMTIKLRELARYELLMEALTRAGVTEIRSPRTGVDDPIILKTRALKAATQNARKKAEEIAAGLGVQAGAPYEIGEEQLPSQIPFQQRMAGRADAEMMRSFGAASVKDFEPLFFVPENITVSATVWVSFKIEG